MPFLARLMAASRPLVVRTRRGLTVEVRRTSRGLAVRPGGTPDHAWEPVTMDDLARVLRTAVGLDEAECQEVVDRIEAAGLA